jgi:hypothetical protein
LKQRAGTRIGVLGSGGEFRAPVETTFQVIEVAPERFPIALRDIRKARVPRFPYVVYYVQDS